MSAVPTQEHTSSRLQRSDMRGCRPPRRGVARFFASETSVHGSAHARLRPMVEACSFCGARTGLRPICGGCATKLADLILQAGSGALQRWWRLAEVPASSPEEISAAIGPHALVLPSEFDHAIRDWKTIDLKEQSREDKATSHADLALAYLEMDLRDEALFEAARALRYQCEGPTAAALKVLFDQRLMRSGAEQSLREVLFPG